MKLHILSDVHVEFGPYDAPETDADVVVLAGDINVGRNGFDWAREQFPNKPVLYVLGNHEYYGEALPKFTDKLRELAEGTNVHILEQDSLTLDGVTFLARIIHELLREGIFSFSCVDSKSIWASRIQFAGALVVKTLQTEF